MATNNTRGLCLVSALLLWLCAVAPAKADRLDDALLKEGGTIVKKLTDAGAKTVGVLNFGVKVGDGKWTWNGGPINESLAIYLENALAKSNDKAGPLAIARDAGWVAKVAMKKEKTEPTLETPEGRRAFFEPTYPIRDSAGRRAKVDTFLFGKVHLNADLKKATIAVVRFNTSDPATIVPVHTFTVQPDPFLLADCGVGYSFSAKQPIARRFSRGVLEDMPVEDDPDTKPGGSTGPGTPVPTAGKPGFPVAIKIYYDEKEVEAELAELKLKTDPNLKQFTRRIATPKVKTSVTIGLKNETNDKMGVVLMVAGKSTLYEVENWRDSPKWILEPGKEYTIAGYLQPGNVEHKEFKIEDDAESARLFQAKGEMVGQIQAIVFRPADDDASKRFANANSLRNPPPIAARLPAGRGVIAPGAVKSNKKVEEDNLGNVVPTDVLVISYYTGK